MYYVYFYIGSIFHRLASKHEKRIIYVILKWTGDFCVEIDLEENAGNFFSRAKY